MASPRRRGPIDAGRYTLRLSHQNYPAVVVLDAQSPRLREDITQRWYPVEFQDCGSIQAGAGRETWLDRNHRVG